MSFGTAASGYPMSAYGKNDSPWQQASRQDNKKKFNYKNKTNKIPLRDRIRQAEEDRLLEEADREARLRANKRLAERRHREQDVVASRVKQSSTRRVELVPNAPNGILKHNKTDSKSDYVTLTQDQLSTILQTLSKVQGSSNELKLDVGDKDHLTLTLDKTDSSIPVSRESDQSITSNTQQLESILNLSRQVKTTNDKIDQDFVSGRKDARSNLNVRGETRKKRPSKQVVMNFNLNGDSQSESQTKSRSKTKKQVKIADEETHSDDEPVFVRRATKVIVVEDEKASDKTTSDKTMTDSTTKPNNEPSISQKEMAQPELSPRQKLLLIPRAHMTIGEKKRLQWELENAAIDKLKKESDKRAQRLGIPLAGTESVAANAPTSNSSTKDNKENYSDANKLTSAKTREQLRKAVVFVEPSFVPGLGDLSDATVASHPQVGVAKEPTQKQSLVTQAPQNLTKAELKRLQWKKEKADAAVEYDPWGRPGAGVGPKAQPVSEPKSDESPQQPLSHRKQQLTSHEQQQQLLLEQTSTYQQSSQPQEGQLVSSRYAKPVEHNSRNVNYKRGPFQEPTSGVPTSMLGIENPSREMFKPAAAPLAESLSRAQLLKLKWAEDKALDQPEYNPFGKPGAGAPIRTDSGTVLTSYHSRQKQMLQRSMEDHPPKDQYSGNSETEAKITKSTIEHSSTVPGLNLNDTGGSSGAVENFENMEDISKRNHIRGQLVNLDVATLKEREEQRQKELRYQDDIRHQVEEKQRVKREERLRKLKEEADEEAKFRAERTNQQQEFEHVRQLNKMKEAKDVNRVDLVADAMQRAKQEAEIFKAKRRLEKLQAAGHDITHLRAAYEEKFSPRVGPIGDMLTPGKEAGAHSSAPFDVLSPRTLNSQSRYHQQQPTVEPSSVPGLDFSSLGSDTKQGHNTSRNAVSNAAGYTSNRIVTPHKWQGGQKENRSPMKEFGVQTDSPVPEKFSRQQKGKPQPNNINRNGSNNKHVRVISGPKTRKNKEPPEPKPWGWKNQVGKKFTAQSKRDPYFVEKQEEKIVRTEARKEQLLRQVEANSKHVPDGKVTDRETVNSYLSPRYKITGSISPREGTSRHKRSSNKSPVRENNYVATKAYDSKGAASAMRGASSARKGIDNAKVKTTSSGVVPSVANALIVSPGDEYVPFLRSDAVLSPSNAQDPSPMSREHTQAALAREAYYKSMKPAEYGVHMHNIKDAHQNAPSRNAQVTSPHSKDPLYNPSLLTKHPTDRQQQVLDSLRQMRQGLMARRREIESVISPDINQQDLY